MQHSAPSYFYKVLPMGRKRRKKCALGLGWELNLGPPLLTANSMYQIKLFFNAMASGGLILLFTSTVYSPN